MPSGPHGSIGHISRWQNQLLINLKCPRIASYTGGPEDRHLDGVFSFCPDVSPAGPTERPISGSQRHLQRHGAELGDAQEQPSRKGRRSYPHVMAGAGPPPVLIWAKARMVGRRLP
jgi:hypothetical protein